MDNRSTGLLIDTVTFQFRVSYSAVSRLFGAFQHRFLRQISDM